MAELLARLPQEALCLVDCPPSGGEGPEPAAGLAALPPRVVRHLLLPASTAMAEMRRQVAAHRPVGIDRLCFSKVDEAGV
ncbi:MAG: hypothetical protein D6739_08955, partial [Nitrospirae bacterium]